METSLLPYMISGSGCQLRDFIRERRESIRATLLRNGAVLLRGFTVGGVAGFEEVAREFCGDLLAYNERSSPRRAIRNRIYSSTDYPPGEEIFLHNENSYQASWPMTIFFYCIEPPWSQGATPLADCRRVLAAIDPQVRAEFERRRWMVVRNYDERLGLSWREAFNTDSRQAVEDHCKRNGVTVFWHGNGGLRTEAARNAVHQHPLTGEQVWFNHATVFHQTTLRKDVQLALLRMCGPGNLPSETFYGDREAIPVDVQDHLRDCYRHAATRFDYHRDDVLVVDNMLVAHGREPFTGPRRILVAMAEPSSG